jgi:hypothetical protein
MAGNLSGEPLASGGLSRSGGRPPGERHEKPKEAVVAEEFKKLTREELEAIAGEPLPDRAAMSLINANVAAPVNLAAALNVLSDDSTATAIAYQDAPIDQSI